MIKYACVTGADRGLGANLAEQLLINGYSVFAGQYAAVWDELQALQERYGERLTVLPLDVGSDASVREAAAFIAERTDQLELLINNAAVLGKDYRQTLLDELDFDDMLNTFNVNALGSLRVTHALIAPLLRGHDKLIVNISSEAGSVGQSWRNNFYGYCMSKTALNMHSTITHNRIRELGGHVLNLHPGWVQGSLSGTFNPNADLTPQFSASKLVEIIMRYRTYQTNQPAFLDYLGRNLLW